MILATYNAGKVMEIKSILGEDIKNLADLSLNIEVEEDAKTFYGNALKKAQAVYEATEEAAIADDSGLRITALSGFPGVVTHRFLGNDATDEERNIALIEMVRDKDRSAEVVCDIVYFNGEDIIVGEGIIKGQIALEPRGENGFGFDPIFELPDGRTLAELTPDEKNSISARYLAIVDLKNKLEKKQEKKRTLK